MQENLYTPGCIRTFSGQYISIQSPDWLKVYVADIAVGLSREPRFAGHTKKFYSVAEHSIWCMEKAQELYPENISLPFQCLLHDAHEAYLKDIPSPIKCELSNYKELAELHQAAIHQRYNVRITHNNKKLVKEIDRMALEWEWENKMLTWKGMALEDQARVDLFIHHFVKLCKHPFTILP